MKQILAGVLVILGVLTVSTTQLTDLVGATNAKIIVSASGLLNSILAGILGILTTQANTVKEVRSMEGVERLLVNEKANPTLAAIALDPAEKKVIPVPGAGPLLEAVTKNGG